MQESDDILKKEVEKIYTPLSVAKEEIWRRWNDKELKKKVDDFLGGDVPEILNKEPRAISTRQIGTPNEEFSIFHEMACLSDLKPLCWEFYDDIFVTTNRDKASLGKLGLLKGLGKKLDPIMKYEKIIDLTGCCENKKFKEISTIWGENLVDFHHSILNSHFPNTELYDASEWYRSKGKNPKKYYPFLLALFIRNGILFDNFNINGYEKTFSVETVLPALQKIEAIFGLKPLIAKIVPEDDIDSIALSSYRYSDSLIQLLTNKKNGKQPDNKPQHLHTICVEYARR